MAKPQDIKGRRYGKLVAVEMLEKSNRYGRWWRCICECGGETEAQPYTLNRGSVTSCGCAHHEGHIAALTTHGMTGSPTWNSWAAMKNRCDCETSKDYPNWGGRGITYCNEWNDFGAFLRDMGERPHGTSLDRIDTHGDYTPENCRWATPVVQINNRRTDKRNKSGTPGVRWDDARQRWKVSHGTVHIGYFGCKLDAVDAKQAYLFQRGLTDQKKQDAGHKSDKMHRVYSRKLRIVEPAE